MASVQAPMSKLQKQEVFGTILHSCKYIFSHKGIVQQFGKYTYLLSNHGWLWSKVTRSNYKLTLKVTNEHANMLRFYLKLS